VRELTSDEQTLLRETVVQFVVQECLHDVVRLRRYIEDRHKWDWPVDLLRVLDRELTRQEVLDMLGFNPYE
jgi:hypothetical protein